MPPLKGIFREENGCRQAKAQVKGEKYHGEQGVWGEVDDGGEVHRTSPKRARDKRGLLSE